MLGYLRGLVSGPPPEVDHEIEEAELHSDDEESGVLPACEDVAAALGEVRTILETRVDPWVTCEHVLLPTCPETCGSYLGVLRTIIEGDARLAEREAFSASTAARTANMAAVVKLALDYAAAHPHDDDSYHHKLATCHAAVSQHLAVHATYAPRPLYTIALAHCAAAEACDSAWQRDQLLAKCVAFLRAAAAFDDANGGYALGSLNDPRLAFLWAHADHAQVCGTLAPWAPRPEDPSDRSDPY